MFGRLAARRGLAALPPLLVEGKPGIGKGHYLHHLVQQLCCNDSYRPFGLEEPGNAVCDCLSCKRMDVRGGADYTVLNGREPISHLRDAIASAAAHQPVQMPKRVLLLRRVDRYSPAAIDTLLSIVETPPKHLRMLATARSILRVPETLRGRFQTLHHAALTAKQVRQVVAGHPDLRPLAAASGTYPFSSVSHLIGAARLRFEFRFREFFLDNDFVGLEKRALAFFRDLEADPELDRSDLLEFFVEWLFWRVAAYCEEQCVTRPGFGQVLAHLPGLVRMNQATAGRFLHDPNPRAHITPIAQFYSLVSSIHMLRRAAGET